GDDTNDAMMVSWTWLYSSLTLVNEFSNELMCTTCISKSFSFCCIYICEYCDPTIAAILVFNLPVTAVFVENLHKQILLMNLLSLALRVIALMPLGLLNVRKKSSFDHQSSDRQGI
ncbi:hypothetical protein J1N35_009971, partial [Gossypium stocksii]